MKGRLRQWRNRIARSDTKGPEACSKSSQKARVELARLCALKICAYTNKRSYLPQRILVRVLGVQGLGISHVSSSNWSQLSLVAQYIAAPTGIIVNSPAAQFPHVLPSTRQKPDTSADMRDLLFPRDLTLTDDHRTLLNHEVHVISASSHRC
jgi:hypothetical protein